MQVELVKEFRFDAAHRNTALPTDELRSRLHGHSYSVGIHIAGPADDRSGWLIDFRTIKEAFRPTLKRLDHHDLNQVDGLSDTTVTGIEGWLGERLETEIPGFVRAEVRILGATALELDVRSGGSGEDGLCRVRFGFCAAHCLPEVPDGHRCKAIHGHSFTIEACGGEEDLRREIESTYPLLDHAYLNDIPGLANSTAENLAAWLWRRWSPQVRRLEEVVVEETVTARCIYRGE